MFDFWQKQDILSLPKRLGRPWTLPRLLLSGHLGFYPRVQSGRSVQMTTPFKLRPICIRMLHRDFVLYLGIGSAVVHPHIYCCSKNVTMHVWAKHFSVSTNKSTQVSQIHDNTATCFGPYRINTRQHITVLWTPLKHPPGTPVHCVTVHCVKIYLQFFCTYSWTEHYQVAVLRNDRCAIWWWKARARTCSSLVCYLNVLCEFVTVSLHIRKWNNTHGM
jgi:hypothetical protein